MPDNTTLDLQWEKNAAFCLWLDSEGRDINGDPPDRDTISAMFQVWLTGRLVAKPLFSPSQ